MNINNDDTPKMDAALDYLRRKNESHDEICGYSRNGVQRLIVEAKKLEIENAALRKDKERLDLLNTLRQYYSRPPLRKVSGWAWSIVDEREERTGDIRDTIDAIINKTENDKITYHKGPEFMASGVAVVHTFKP